VPNRYVRAPRNITYGRTTDAVQLPASATNGNGRH
jgi:hypothetical protein